MGILNFFKKSTPNLPEPIAPYQDSATNFVYNLLFCDDLNLFKENAEKPNTYPFNILFSETSSVADLQRIIDDTDTDPRVKILAYNLQRAKGHVPDRKEVIGVIVEVGLEYGLDTLASFNDGTARYINQIGKIIVWEATTDSTVNAITQGLFEHSKDIVNAIGPWDKPRRPNPKKGDARITFLVTDGLYFGEAPIDVLFNDPMANPALMDATALMQYLTGKALENQK